MIQKYNPKINIFLNTPVEVVYPHSIRDGIALEWANFIKDKNPKDFFNGDVYLVTDIKKDASDAMTLNVGLSKFADLIYARKTNLLKVKSLFVASYIVTDDNDVIVIQNRRKRINTIGGMADKTDFENNRFSPFKCLSREWKEELGIDLNNEAANFSAVPKYIKLPNEKEMELPVFPIGILYEVKTMLSTEELRRQFDCNADATDGEVVDLVVYDKDSFTTLGNDINAEPYLYELFYNHYFM